jgi:hypothetical protein
VRGRRATSARSKRRDAPCSVGQTPSEVAATSVGRSRACAAMHCLRQSGYLREMRRLAGYALESSTAFSASTTDRLSLIRTAVDDWFTMKGQLSADRTLLLSEDGRTIAIQHDVHQCRRGRVERWSLTEPLAMGQFSTVIEAGGSDQQTCLGIELSALANNLAPFDIDPNPPRILSLLFDLPFDWHYRGTRLPKTPIFLRGQDGGLEAIRLIWARDRSVPVVVISDEEGLVLHPGIESSIARDLIGLAIVLRIDDEAAWALTEGRGKDWSCYGGAIRLYWPAVERFPSPFDHALWTAQRLMDGAVDSYAAARRLRAELKRSIVSQSGLCIASPSLIGDLLREARHEEIDAVRERVKSSHLDQAWVDDLFDKWSAATDRCDQLAARVRDLEAEKEALIESLRASAAGANASPSRQLEPVHEAPPSTVRDAVLLAQIRHPKYLRFGNDVWDGVNGIRTDTSTAMKVSRSLECLAQLARETQDGAVLGRNVLQWLTDHGERASGESQTVNNKQRARQARTWDDGAGQRSYFEHHLKPKEATSPDQCVRIYFQHQPAMGLVVIGWVGRHPPE